MLILQIDLLATFHYNFLPNKQVEFIQLYEICQSGTTFILSLEKMRIITASDSFKQQQRQQQRQEQQHHQKQRRRQHREPLQQKLRQNL